MIHNDTQLQRLQGLRLWLRGVVMSCTWCSFYQAFSIVEREAGRKAEETVERGPCTNGNKCDSRARMFWKSMPKPGEVAELCESDACPTCRARAHVVKVGERIVYVCATCWEKTNGKA